MQKQNYEDYFRTCQYILHRGPRRGIPCGKGCTFDVYGNLTDFCSSHYVTYLQNPNTCKGPLPFKAKATPSHPTYQAMIVEAIADANEALGFSVVRNGASIPVISRYISCTWHIHNSILKTQLRHSLRRAVENGSLVKVRASYRLATGTKAKFLVSPANRQQ